MDYLWCPLGTKELLYILERFLIDVYHLYVLMYFSFYNYLITVLLFCLGWY
jgi:hypothetical protein